jgi:hypothetical protein
MAGFGDGLEQAGWPSAAFLRAVTASPLVQEAIRSAQSVPAGLAPRPAGDPRSAIERGVAGGLRRAGAAGLVADGSAPISDPVDDVVRAALAAVPTEVPSDVLVERLAKVAAILLSAGLPHLAVFGILLDVVDGIRQPCRRPRRPCPRPQQCDAGATRRPRTRRPGAWYADGRAGLGHR